MKNMKENITKGITQEDKELLLKDLCGRILYHPKGLVVNACTGAECEEWLTCATFSMFTSVTNNCRLYLRPMWSMTIEERQDWIKYCKADYDCEFHPELTFDFESCILSINWLNAHHFDYRGLIPKGLAIAVTEENNPYK